MKLIDWEQRELPISTQAELLHLKRSSLYYQPLPPSPEEVAFKHRIDEIFTEHPYYGYRRIAAQLHREGQAINKKTEGSVHARDGIDSGLSRPELEQAST